MDVRRRIQIGGIKKVTSGGGSTTEGSYTVNLNSQWEATTAVPNPDSTLYDGVYRSLSNYNVDSGVSIMYITIKDCSSFKMYIRSYAESNYDYVMVSQLDKTINGNTTYSDTTLVKAHTRGNQQSGTTLSNYTLVEFTGITYGEHTITVVYRKDSSVNSGDDRGYVLIEKMNADSGDSGGSGEENVIIDNYLSIEALEDGLTASLSVNACEYCVDGDGNWKSLAAGTATQSINRGHTLSFRGNLTPTTSDGIGTFTILKKCNLKGNCMSMLFKDNAANNYSLSGKDHAFYLLFRNCTNIINVSSNFLPSTSMSDSCYYLMFGDCTSLTTSPELPSTTLANQCYSLMFSGCTNLTTAPELPATTLATYCYKDMFYGCTRLTTAPELPATTLADYCYRRMFYGCTRLTTAPELPATTLATMCYEYMFGDCINLTTAPELPATTLAIYCYYGMFSYCSNLTTTPSILPATTLANYCYEHMFQYCSNLTTAPELPATTLTRECYYNMFSGCSKLNYIKMLSTDVSAYNCLYNWVGGVASTGTFVKHPDITTLPTGTSGIPSGWTVVDAEEENNTSISLCDVAYWDGSAVKTCSYNNYNTSLGTAIGVVVIPEGFAPDGKARIVGLKPMDSFGMTNSYKISLYWDASGNYVDTSLTNYTKVPTTDNVSSNSTGSASISNSTTGNGCLPSDKFTGIQSYVDAISKYSVTSYLIPSPYSGDTYNPEYYKTISGNNALSDFNGLSNTQALVSLGSNYQAANYCWDYNDGSGSNIQWYLPAMGELGYLMPRLNAIDEIIVSLGGVAIQDAATLWSSSEYDSENVNYLELGSGRIRRRSKVTTTFARSFATIDNGSTNLITFTVDGVAYQFEDGMTWKDWCNSVYNTAEFIYDWTENQYGIYTSDYEKFFIYGLKDSSLVTTGVYLTYTVDWPM